MVDEPPDSFLHCLTAKVQEQPYGLFHQPQIGDQLLCVNWGESFYRFDFDNKLFVHQQIDAKRSFEAHSIVMYVDRHLPIDLPTRARQACRKDSFVDAFKQSRPKFAVNLDGRIDNLCADAINFLHTFSASPRLRAKPPIAP